MIDVLKKKRANNDLRDEWLRIGLKQWQIAEAVGITEGNFCRKLRKELPESEKKIIRNIIMNLTGKEVV